MHEDNLRTESLPSLYPDKLLSTVSTSANSFSTAVCQHLCQRRKRFIMIMLLLLLPSDICFGMPLLWPRQSLSFHFQWRRLHSYIIRRIDVSAAATPTVAVLLYFYCNCDCSFGDSCHIINNQWWVTMGLPFLVMTGGVDFPLFGDLDSGSGTMVKERAISWFIPEKKINQRWNTD